jgi:hypothetical protein
MENSHKYRVWLDDGEDFSTVLDWPLAGCHSQVVRSFSEVFAVEFGDTIYVAGEDDVVKSFKLKVVAIEHPLTHNVEIPKHELGNV